MRNILTILILTVFGINLFAYVDKDTIPPEQIKNNNGIILSYGSTTLDRKNGIPKKIWNEYHIKPRFKTDHVLLGLDLVFHFDEDTKLDTDDWNDFGDIIDKLDYLYFNTMKDPVFLRLGQLSNVTFGSGFIVNHYSNMITYPLKEKKVGLDLGIKSPWDDKLEFFTNDLDAARIFGLRASIVPLDFVEVGFNYVLDKDPLRNNNSPESLHFFALDVSSPLVKRKRSAFYIYENLAKILDHGLGFSSGIKWELPFGDFKGEYRFYDANFTPSYFNEYYDLDSAVKYQDLRALNTDKKFGGFLFSGNVNTLDNHVNVQSSIEKFMNSGRAVHFYTKIGLKQLPFSNLDFNISYDDKDAHLADFGYDKKNVTIISDATYSISKNATLKIDFKRIYDENGVARKLSSFSTEIKF